MFKKLLKTNADMVNKKPKIVLIGALIITIIAGILATNLSMELNWISLAPEGSPAVQEYQEIMEEFPSMDSIIVLVESDDYDMLQEAANETAAELDKLDEYVYSVVSGVDREFMLENAFMFMSTDEVNMMKYVFSDVNADKMYEFMYYMMNETSKEIENGKLSDEEMQYAASTFIAMSSIIEETNNSLNGKQNKQEMNHALEQFFAGNSLLTSPDAKMAMMTIQPTFDMMDAERIIPGVNAIENVIKSVNDKYENVSIRDTGMHIVARDEMASIESDSYLTTLISIILILALLYFSFRIWVAPIFAVTPLLFGIVWSMGIAGVIIGRLNMMTVFAVAMLLGLGVDYSIHIYSSYTERRSRGIDKETAIEYAICHTGPSIIVGALTTAIAFLSLNISKLRILSELGTVMGIGIITTLVAVFWILPALIKVKKEKEERMRKIPGDFKFIGIVAKGVYKVKYIVLALIVLGAVFMGYKASKIEFDMNIMNIEPEGLESIELMNYMVDKYDMSSNSFALQVDTLDEVYDLHKQFEQAHNVSEVISVASILPKVDEQNEKIRETADFKKVLDNQVDLRDMDKAVLLQYISIYKEAIEKYEKAWLGKDLPVLQKKDFDKIKQEIDALESTLKSDIKTDNIRYVSQSIYDGMNEIGNKMVIEDIIKPSDLPDAYKAQFLSKDEQKYLITVYPNFEIWDSLGKEKGDEFLAELAAIDPSITGTPIFMMDLYNAVGDELMITGIVLIIILLTILLVHFKSIKYTMLAFLPLAFTLVYMVGTMAFLNIKFNMINFLVILLVIGIGLDDGVHVLHHYKMGEHDIKRLFSTIGRAILLTTVTTVFGFGSLGFSSYRGIAGLGIVLAIGVSMALIFTVIILPIFLKDEQDIK
ncbi:MAG: MMPL family transporter [Eubacteriales bacterium]